MDEVHSPSVGLPFGCCSHIVAVVVKYPLCCRLRPSSPDHHDDADGSNDDDDGGDNDYEGLWSNSNNAMGCTIVLLALVLSITPSRSFRLLFIHSFDQMLAAILPADVAACGGDETSSAIKREAHRPTVIITIIITSFHCQT